MSKTLILLFHPEPARSQTNAALAAAAATLPEVDVVDLQTRYPDHRIDIDMEVERLLTAERLVLQFPLHWYAPPPLLQAWQSAVLTRMYYLRYDQEGRRLEGMPLLVAATAGNESEAMPPRE